MPIAGHSLFAPHAETIDGYDGDDFQFSQAVAEYGLGQSDLTLDLGISTYKIGVWKLFPN